MGSQSLKLRTILALIGLTLTVVWVVPNVVNLEDKWWFSKNKLNYGLDIQGGLHLVMGVDVESVVAESVNRLIGNLKTEIAKETLVTPEILASNPSIGELTFTVKSADEKTKVAAYLNESYATMLLEVGGAENTLTYRYLDAYLLDYKNRVIQQSIETIRNRIDEFGVAEPSIARQGDNRILIQLPGMADAERAKSLINTTAKLDFMIVNYDKNAEELRAMITEAEQAGGYKMADMKYSEYVDRLNKDLQGKLPAKTAIFFEKAGNAVTMADGAVPYLLQTDSNLGGNDLDDAFVSYDQYGAPEVSLRFNVGGAAKFAELTGANVNKQMAIVLDKVVKSAPSIRDRIGGGSAVISLGSTRNREASLDEAKMISTSLRAGALPASLEQLEERRVGPSLGSDSIQKAQTASYIGAALIILFMLAYYKGMGVVSVVVLAINILAVFGLLSTIGATLTLPGIAGIALTVGFAVDANVLINERMREEIRRGMALKSAIRDGYDKAMSAIIDSNITTAATAIVLLYFGTGPVRGFAVTLLIGIVTTLFANVFVSKVIVDTLVYKFGVKKISV
ncbi:MAG: protein translocase subunit SecD [Bdellovibrionia bacterium]